MKKLFLALAILAAVSAANSMTTTHCYRTYNGDIICNTY